ncbi:MAG: hypothetical protein NZM15_09235 [Flavobacteriales bacterium]|nr:hypothetical protein [Flavobacteriales bacterium]MDW8432871.1 hypothetical protein [Flavobacteriales bacterium]
MRFLCYGLLVLFVSWGCKKEKPLEKGQMKMKINGKSIRLTFGGQITIVQDTIATATANSGPQGPFKRMTLQFNRFGTGELNNTPEYPIRTIMTYQESNATFSSHYLNNLIGEASATVEEINTGERFVKGKFKGYLRGLTGSLETRNIEDGEFFLAISL